MKPLQDCVVIFNQGSGGGTLSSFLNQLSTKNRRQYNFVAFYATLYDKIWVDALKLKLQQLCKKNCKKPIVVSALFNTEQEMSLSSIQQYALKWYLTSSTGEVKISWANQLTLPLPNSNLPRNNIFYNCNFDYPCKIKNVYGPEITPNRNYINSIFANVARGGESIVRINDAAAIDNETLIADLTSFDKEPVWNLAVPREELDLSPLLSDRALQQVALGYGDKIGIERLENSNYVVLEDSDERRYIKIYARADLTPHENLAVILGFSGMEKVRNPSSTMNIRVNLAISAGIAFDRFVRGRD